MSRSYHQRGFVSPFPFPSSSPINSFTIPRSYNHSSDESETGSPSGGGGGNYSQGPAGHAAFTSPHSQVDDTPFVPKRGHHEEYHSGAVRELTLPPDSRNYDYNYRGPQVSVGPDVYPQTFQSHGVYSGHISSGPHVYPQDPRSAGNQRGQWRPIDSSHQGYYRDYTALYSEREFLSGTPVPNVVHASPPFQGFEGPRSLPSPGSSSGYDSHQQSPTSPPLGLHPTAFEAPLYPDAGEYLRQQLNIPPGHRVDLWALPDPPPGQRPSQALPILMKLAIYGSPQQKLTLREIYAALENRFAWFRDNTDDQSWKNSIRHNLSLNKVFRNVQRPITEPGKGRYWVLDVSEGEGYKRERKRRVKGSKSFSDEDNSTAESSW